jgi:GDPmannose 4,6-dehydratase
MHIGHVNIYNDTMNKIALITGITGQDGRYLAEFLHQKKYDIYGIVHGQRNHKLDEVGSEFPYVKLIDGDITDISSMIRAIQTVKPNEIYNLAAISHVGYSFKDPIATLDVNAKSVLNILEAIRLTSNTKNIRFYQASTSEMFGGTEYNRPKQGYNENSLFHPRSPYGVAKLCAH